MGVPPAFPQIPLPSFCCPWERPLVSTPSLVPGTNQASTRRLLPPHPEDQGATEGGAEKAGPPTFAALTLSPLGSQATCGAAPAQPRRGSQPGLPGSSDQGTGSVWVTGEFQQGFAVTSKERVSSGSAQWEGWEQWQPFEMPSLM